MTNMPSISRHNERQNERYGNEDIDSSRTEQNYHLKQPVESSYEKEFQRIREKHGLKGNLRLTGNKQSNVACEFLITSDNEFFSKMDESQTRKFFEDSYEFVKTKCKDEYVISAVVHMDERTPHMHVTYIPVVQGKDRQGNPCERINCSQFWKGFNSYGQLQDEFYKHIYEKGYDLERGEVGSDREHLSVEEYKLQARETELFSKKEELNRLEQIDTVVGLDAEKGKLAYSTKEVESIKEQNKALKLEKYELAKQNEDLTNTVKSLENRILEGANKLKENEVSVNHLKDLECEKQALSKYLELNSELKTKMSLYFRLVEKAHSLGKKIAELKKSYHRLGNDRDVSIQRTHRLSNEVNGKEDTITVLNSYKAHMDDLSKQTDVCMAQRNELAKMSLKNLMRVSERKELDNRIAELQKQLETERSELSTKYGIDYPQINSKIMHYKDDIEIKQGGIGQQKAETQRIEEERRNVAKEYKYTVALADTQEVELRDITTRKYESVKLPAHEEKALLPNVADRKEILERMEIEYPKQVSKCKQMFAKKYGNHDEQFRERKITDKPPKSNQNSIEDYMKKKGSEIQKNPRKNIDRDRSR